MLKKSIVLASGALIAVGLTACDVDKTQEGNVTAPAYEVNKTQEGSVTVPKYDVTPPDVNVSKQERTVEVPTVKTEEKTVTVPKVEITPAPDK